MAVSPCGILAYAALSVNSYMLAYEQAPRQPYIRFRSQQSCQIPQCLTSLPEAKNIKNIFRYDVENLLRGGIVN